MAALKIFSFAKYLCLFGQAIMHHHSVKSNEPIIYGTSQVFHAPIIPEFNNGR